MKIELEVGYGRNIIRAYEAGRITVNEQSFSTSLIVTPERIVTDWQPRSFADLSPADLAAITALEPEVVLLGTGARLRFPKAALTRPLLEAGIGFEAMDTGAACRTYNVLMGEGRRVAAGLLLIEEE